MTNRAKSGAPEPAVVRRASKEQDWSPPNWLLSMAIFFTGFRNYFLYVLLEGS